jgi:hypothetical protein
VAHGEGRPLLFIPSNIGALASSPIDSKTARSSRVATRDINSETIEDSEEANRETRHGLIFHDGKHSHVCLLLALEDYSAFKRHACHSPQV